MSDSRNEMLPLRPQAQSIVEIIFAGRSQRFGDVILYDVASREVYCGKRLKILQRSTVLCMRL